MTFIDTSFAAPHFSILNSQFFILHSQFFGNLTPIMATENKVNVGVIGTGNISSIYLESPQKFDILNIAAVADIDMSRAQAQAEKYGVPKACSPEELLADPSIEIVINLTVPLAHGDVALQALEAGKHVYNEKPLAYDQAQAKAMLALAKKKKRLVGGAPDTFLGGGLQTCRALIDAGEIGTPVYVHGQMLSRGMESWHPNPNFFFQPGGGPMFDMGPYYLTAMIALLGPATAVSGSTRIVHPERTITSQPLNGTKIQVNTPTTIMGLIDFANGAIGTLATSFDVSEGYAIGLTIHGTKAVLQVPDPNGFGGPVRIKRADSNEFVEVPIAHRWNENSRGIGVADMAYAIRNKRPHRASGDQANHALEMMHAFHTSAKTGRRITLKSKCKQPAPLPENFPDSE